SRQGDTKNAIKGATLNRDSIAKILLPLPPLTEQHRIIAKLRELMALCNRLEDTWREREARRDRLAISSHFYLNNGSSEETLRPRVAFYLEHLSELTKSSEQITALRQTILSLALRGRLVSQDTNDEHAALLLRRVGQEIKAYTREQGISLATPD